MITIPTVENVFTNVYLDVLRSQLNAGVECTTKDVWGKEVRKLIWKDSDMTEQEHIVRELKNFYGSIEITDKEIRGSSTKAGSFVDSLNDRAEDVIIRIKRQLKLHYDAVLNEFGGCISDYELHQLCDWQWLKDDDGKILRLTADGFAYSATLVKYAHLMPKRHFRVTAELQAEKGEGNG